MIGLLARTRGQDKRFLSHVVVKEFASNLSFRQYQNAVRNGEHLEKLGRDKEHRQTLFSQPIHDFENLGLGSDINAARWFIQEQHLGLRQQALGKDDLLLVTTAQAR